MDIQTMALKKLLLLLKKIEWRENNGSYTKTKKPFQKGLACAIRATLELIKDFKLENIEYILTKR